MKEPPNQQPAQKKPNEINAQPVQNERNNQSTTCLQKKPMKINAPFAQKKMIP
jgi:hypothetical protein